MNFKGIELKKLQLEESLKREREKTAYLQALRGIRGAPGFELFSKKIQERSEVLLHSLKSGELSPYEQGRIQGELKVLETWLKDDVEIGRALDRAADHIRDIHRKIQKLPGFLQET